MNNAFLAIWLFQVVYGKNLHEIRHPEAETSKKAIRQRTMEKAGRSFRVIPMETTLINDRSDTKTYREAENACKAMGGKLATTISREKYDDKNLDGNGYYYWVGATRNTTRNRRDPWHWVGGEITKTGGHGNWGADAKGDCLTTYYNYFYDKSCSENHYFSCELPRWRQYYQVHPKGYYEIKIKNTYIIVQDPNKDYDVAAQECSKFGGKLARFFTYRELDLIDENLRSGDFSNVAAQWRFWIGAKKTSYFDEGKWSTGEVIPSGFLDVEHENGGYCLIYHAQIDNDGNLQRSIAWEECLAEDNTNFKINGYICELQHTMTTY